MNKVSQFCKSKAARPTTPEEKADFEAMFDETLWLYMRTLRRTFHWDRDITRFLNEVCPDVVARYGVRRLLEMANGMHRPDFRIAESIVNKQ